LKEGTSLINSASVPKEVKLPGEVRFMR